MVTTRTFDPRCYDLAELFLEDETHLGGESQICALAAEIQRTIEDFIAGANAEMLEREAEARDRAYEYKYEDWVERQREKQDWTIWENVE
ncbi:MAG TPA: hypothetical protein VF077_03850 [Nitrospiraceae bacterium]